MVCESTGEPCRYQMHAEKIHSLAVGEAGMAESATDTGLYQEIAETMEKVLDSDEQCSDGYCKILDAGMAEAFINTAFIRHRFKLLEAGYHDVVQ